MWVAHHDRWITLVGVVGMVLILVGLIALIAGPSVARDVEDGE